VADVPGRKGKRRKDLVMEKKKRIAAVEPETACTWDVILTGREEGGCVAKGRRKGVPSFQGGFELPMKRKRTLSIPRGKEGEKSFHSKEPRNQYLRRRGKRKRSSCQRGRKKIHQS